MKKRYAIILILIVCAVYIFSDIYVVEKKGYDSIWDYLFGKEEKRLIDSEEYVLSNPQMIEVEDYQITLCNAMYEEEKNFGACKFTVVKNGGKDKVRYNKKNISGYFGENGRFFFRFGIMDSGSVIYDIEYEEKGNMLILYLDFELDTKAFYDKIYLMDCISGYDSEDTAGVFKLSDNIKTINFPVSDTLNIRLSESEMIIQSTEKMQEDNNIVTLYYKDGTSKEAECSISMLLDSTRRYYIDKVFEESFHINEINYIEYNGQKYYVEKENVNVDGIY